MYKAKRISVLSFVYRLHVYLLKSNESETGSIAFKYKGMLALEKMHVIVCICRAYPEHLSTVHTMSSKNY